MSSFGVSINYPLKQPHHFIRTFLRDTQGSGSVPNRSWPPVVDFNSMLHGLIIACRTNSSLTQIRKSSSDEGTRGIARESRSHPCQNRARMGHPQGFTACSIRKRGGWGTLKSCGGLTMCAEGRATRPARNTASFLVCDLHVMIGRNATP